MKSSKVHQNFLSSILQFVFHLVFSRFTLAGILIALQVAIIVLFAIFFSRYMILLFGGSAVIGLFLTIYIINHDDNPSFQISWIILILLFPTIGVFVYLFVKLQFGVKSFSSQYQKVHDGLVKYIPQKKKVLDTLKQQNLLVYRYALYMNQESGYPISNASHTKYYSFGENAYDDLLNDLKKAQKYIFLEFFIVAKGVFWNSILEILKEKVKSGVKVYFMYDGTCSFFHLPHDYPNELSQFGIHTKIFNPIIPIISTHYNNRDHRKIVVVDGEAAYTGGVNLADEYINQKERFGVWKDTMIRVEGEAVQNFVIQFLENWNVTEKNPLNAEEFLVKKKYASHSSYLLPFGDSPCFSSHVAVESYAHMIETATDYIHIMMPYFIVDYRLLHSLCNAARSGVDVKLIMPGIPDKKLIYYISRSFYETLLSNGVQVYEYIPGFTHAKMVISDEEKAMIGTINLDFRSLFLHFENAVYLYKDSSIQEMEKDYQNTLKDCRLVTLRDVKRFPWWQKILGRVLRVFAPLL